MIPERFIWLVFSQLVLALHECHYGTKADGFQRPAILHRYYENVNENVKLLLVMSNY